jgi:hypothetical protein
MSDVVVRARAARLISVKLPERTARRRLRILLGMIWLLDAALQFQPYMFSRGFPVGIIDQGYRIRFAIEPYLYGVRLTAASPVSIRNVSVSCR